MAIFRRVLHPRRPYPPQNLNHAHALQALANAQVRQREQQAHRHLAGFLMFPNIPYPFRENYLEDYLQAHPQPRADPLPLNPLPLRERHLRELHRLVMGELRDLLRQREPQLNPLQAIETALQARRDEQEEERAAQRRQTRQLYRAGERRGRQLAIANRERLRLQQHQQQPPLAPLPDPDFLHQYAFHNALLTILEQARQQFSAQ